MHERAIVWGGRHLMTGTLFVSLDILCLVYSLGPIPGESFTFYFLESQCPHCLCTQESQR